MDPSRQNREGKAVSFARRPPWPGLASLLEGEAFRFQFQLRPGREGWLDASHGDPDVLALRQSILGTPRAPAWTPWADATWERVEERLAPALRWVGRGPREAVERARRVSGAWAPDFVLLRPLGGELRMVGGSVCFPSGWDPVEKLGGTVADIHGPVPTLNEGLGARIGKFLGSLREGDVVERDNWGLAATGRLDLHPADRIPRIEVGMDAGQVWFRLEEQAFVGLGEGHVLFLIHVRTWPLPEFLGATGCADALGRMLASMPPEVARYKGVAGWTLGAGQPGPDPARPPVPGASGPCPAA